MPTEMLRRASTRAPGGPDRRRAPGAPRRALIRAGRAVLRIELLETPTADLIWGALPLHSTAETWGASLHFELPIESGRERGAKLNTHPGEICYWSRDDRVLIAWGATPISGAAIIRLPAPCNVWARALDEVGALASVRPGEKISLTALADGEENRGEPERTP